MANCTVDRGTYHVHAPVVSDRLSVHDDRVVVVDEPVDGREWRSSSHLTAHEHADVVDERSRRLAVDDRRICLSQVTFLQPPCTNNGQDFPYTSHGNVLTS